MVLSYTPQKVPAPLKEWNKKSNVQKANLTGRRAAGKPSSSGPPPAGVPSSFKQPRCRMSSRSYALPGMTSPENFTQDAEPETNGKAEAAAESVSKMSAATSETVVTTPVPAPIPTPASAFSVIDKENTVVSESMDPPPSLGLPSKVLEPVTSSGGWVASFSPPSFANQVAPTEKASKETKKASWAGNFSPPSTVGAKDEDGSPPPASQSMFLMTFSPGELTKKPDLRKKPIAKPPRPQMSTEKIQRHVIDVYSGRKPQEGLEPSSSTDNEKRNTGDSSEIKPLINDAPTTVDMEKAALFSDIEDLPDPDKEQIAELLAKMIDVEKEKEQLVLELQDAKQQAEEEEKKVAERDQVVEVFQQRVAELEEAAANMTAVNSEERGTQMEIKDEVGDALRQQKECLLQEHNAALESMNAELISTKGDLQEQITVAKNFEELMTTARSQIDQYESAASVTKTQIEAMESTLKTFDSEKASYAAEAIEKNTLIGELRSQLASVESATSEEAALLKQNEDELRTEVDHLKETVEGLEAARASSKSAMADLQETVDQLEAARSSSESAITAAKEELEAAILAQQSAVAERDQSILQASRASEAIAQNETTIETLRAELETARSSSEAQVRGLIESEAALRAECDEHKATIGEKDAKIAVLYTDLETAHSSSEAQVHGLIESEAALRAECDEHKANIEALSSQLASVESATSEQAALSQQNEDELRAEVDYLKETVEELKSTRASIEKEAGSIKQKLDTAIVSQQSARKEHDLAVAERETATELMRKVQSELFAQTEISTQLRKDMEDQEALRLQEIASLQEQLRSANEEIKAVEARGAAELAAQISDSSSKIQRAKDELAQFQGTVSEQMRNYQRISNEFEALHKVRRELHNKVVELRGNNRVFCRIRPGEHDADLALVAQETRDCIDVNEVIHRLNREETRLTSYHFDRVFGPTVSQSDLYAEVRPLVQSAFDGYPVCIFAYGQTGSGKTHTMLGDKDPNNQGIMFRACDQVFSSIESSKKAGWKYSVNVQIVEVYNEKLRDLLTDAPVAEAPELAARTDPTTGTVYVENLSIHEATCSDDAIVMLQRALDSRCTKATNMNSTSSRSHCIFTMRFRGERASTSEVSDGIMHFCDLAGSERLAVSGSAEEPALLREAQNINKSLSCLGNTISALVRGDSHVPYRDSRLTYLLSGSLGGNGKCLMLCNLGGERSHLQESLGSLRFAQKVSKVKKQQPCKACAARAKYGEKNCVSEQERAAEEK